MIASDDPIDVDDVAGHYNDLDRFYREIWGDHVHHGFWVTGQETPKEATENLVDLVATNLQLQKEQSVLDIGCGYGATAKKLSQDYGVNVVGVTVSESQYQYASQSVADLPLVSVLSQDILRNGFDSHAFDRVVSIECISHVVDKRKFFSEVARVLRPGGRAVIIAWLVGESPTDDEIKRLLEPICREGRLPSMASESEYRDIIASKSLELESFEDLTLRVARTWRICLRRLAGALLVKPPYWRFLASRESRHSVFLFTLLRILRAYRCGAMRYGMFVITKPDQDTPASPAD